MYAVASCSVPWSPPLVRGRHCQPLLRGRRGTMCTAKGSDVRPGVPLASLLRLLLRGRCGTRCTAKRSDVRPSVPLASLGLRRFCVAGVRQCALPGGRVLTHTLTHSLTHSPTCACTYIHTHTHKLTHHHPSITLILPLPFLLFYAQSKSREVGNMWGYPLL